MLSLKILFYCFLTIFFYNINNPTPKQTQVLLLLCNAEAAGLRFFDELSPPLDL